ncbi:MAG: chromate efflux transporter [Geminicoccaceae bacterium]
MSPAPSFAEATRTWLKIGLLGFGGPAGQIALMHRLLVDEKRWLGEQQFLHALNFCMLLPGPEAQQLATYAGWILHGWRGGLVAGTLFVLPGFVVIVALSALYAGFSDTAWLQSLFFGLKAAVLAVVVEALLKVARRALKTRFMYAVAAVAFVAIWALHVPFPLIVLAAALLGTLLARTAPGLIGIKAPAEPLRETPTPSPLRSLAVLAGGLALWLGPVVLLVAVLGRHDLFSELAVYFSKMAVVTFGGAYAVLAWVAQAAVGEFGWLQPGQMVDGLALAETTPGPLIMVLTFVGFLAAFQHPGGLDPMLAGLLGATLVTWVTFAPCFLWIFLGAPYVERLRGRPLLAGALATITAAVVGVILNLAVWFALHVLFRELVEADVGPFRLLLPRLGTLDPAALVLAALACWTLFGTRLGMLGTLALCGVLGAGWRLLAG